VDVEAFAAAHGAEWERLTMLTRRSRLTATEADEVVRLYQAVATHLSTIRSAAPDPALVSELSQLLGHARARIAGSHEASWRDLGRFFLVSLPAAFYRVRWWTVGAALLSIGLAVAVGIHIASTPAAMAQLGTPSELKAYADQAFEAYYSNHPAPAFAAQVWTNNAWIAAQSIGLGITGFIPVMVLFQNFVHVGEAAAIMANHGHLGAFFGLILPHGQLELTAIFIACGTGLKLFWTMVDPGHRPRGRALAEEGRSLITVALGLVGVLAISGVIEGFVVRTTLPTGVKIAIGTLALAAYWTYTLVLGRRAVAAGETGDVGADYAGATLPVVG